MESCSALPTHLAGPVGHTPGLRRCHAVQAPAPRTDCSLTQSLPELQQPRLSRLASALNVHENAEHRRSTTVWKNSVWRANAAWFTGGR